MLAGAARGEMGSKGGGGPVKLSDVYTLTSPLLPVSPLAAPANTGVSLPLQLMKVWAESFNYLSTFIVICLLQ